jgi:hypothetical protein
VLTWPRWSICLSYTGSNKCVLHVTPLLSPISPHPVECSGRMTTEPWSTVNPFAPHLTIYNNLGNVSEDATYRVPSLKAGLLVNCTARSEIPVECARHAATRPCCSPAGRYSLTATAGSPSGSSLHCPQPRAAALPTVHAVSRGTASASTEATALALTLRCRARPHSAAAVRHPALPPRPPPQQ